MADTTPKFNLKYGKLSELKNMAPSNGTISVTTDTHSMFIDLDGKRFRLSDFEIYENIQELINDKNSWYDGCLALIKSDGTNGVTNAPILAYYDTKSNSGAGGWVNINDTSALSTAIADNEEAIAENAEAIGVNTAAIAANAEAIAENAEAIGVNTAAIAALKGNSTKSLEELEETIQNILGNTGDGSSLTIAGLSAAINQEKTDREAADAGLATQIASITKDYVVEKELTEAINNAKTYAETKANAAQSAAEKVAMNKASAAQSAAKTYTDQEIEKVDTAISAIVNGDSGKTIREIASEEVATIVADAHEDYDTLKEIADWIINDTTGSAQMANDISALKTKTTLGTQKIIEDGVEKEVEYNTVKAYVEAYVGNIQTSLAAQITELNNILTWQPFTTTTTE